MTLLEARLEMDVELKPGVPGIPLTSDPCAESLYAWPGMYGGGEL